MNKPKYALIDNEKYEINTDFRVALDCNKISMNKDIGIMEKSYAIVYKLFGEKGLNSKHFNKLFELALKFISLNRDNSEESEEKQKYQLDFSKCIGLIKSSFKFDYGYDPYELEYLHWYDFYNDLENLSTSEFGNCCILNRVLSVLNEDTSKIKDSKERTKINNAKKMLKRKYCIDDDIQITKEQEKSATDLLQSLNMI